MPGILEGVKGRKFQTPGIISLFLVFFVPQKSSAYSGTFHVWQIHCPPLENITFKQTLHLFPTVFYCKTRFGDLGSNSCLKTGSTLSGHPHPTNEFPNIFQVHSFSPSLSQKV